MHFFRETQGCLNRTGAALILFATVILALCSFNVNAAGDVTLDVGVEATIDDNVARLEEAFSDTKLTFFGGLTAESSSSFVDVSLNYEVDHSEYQKKTFSSRHSADGLGRVLLHTTSRAITWVFENEEKDLVADVAQADTPNNRRQQSVYRTGPSLNLRLSPLNYLSTSAYIEESHLKDGKSDTQRKVYDVSWQRQLTKKLSFSLGGEFTDLSLDESSNEYTRRRAYAEYSRRINDGKIVARGGYATTELNNSGQDFKGVEYHLIFSHGVGYGNFLLLDVTRSLTDSGVSSFRSIEEDSNFILGDDGFKLLKADDIRLQYTMPIARNGRIAFTLSRIKKTDDLSISSEIADALGARWTKPITAVTNFVVQSRFQEFSVENAPTYDKRKSRHIGVEFSLDRRFGENTSGVCRIRYLKRYGELGRTYRSNSVQCGIDYRVF